MSNEKQTSDKQQGHTSLAGVSEIDLFECPACDEVAAYVVQGYCEPANEKRSYDLEVEHCACKSCGYDWWD